MKVWYCVIGNEQTGPVGADEIREWMGQGRLTPDSLVWKDGMAEWTPIKKIPEFQSTPSIRVDVSSIDAASPYLPPSMDANEAIQWDSYTPSGSQVRPWLRFWARVADMCLFGIFTGVVAYFIYPAYEEMSDILSGVLVTALMVPVEAAMLSALGTTPGKAIFDIRVRNHNGSRLDFQQALIRASRIWIRGEGLALPLISLITHFSAYKRLSESGITSWDHEGGHLVGHRTMSWWRILIIFVSFSGVLGLIVSIEEFGAV